MLTEARIAALNILYSVENFQMPAAYYLPHIISVKTEKEKSNLRVMESRRLSIAPFWN